MQMTARERTDAAYKAHVDKMQFIAAYKFRVPAADVRPLIHDVFIAYMRHVAAIGDDGGWLLTATKNACLNYWRDKKEPQVLPEDTLLDSRRLSEEVNARVDVARVLRLLPKRCRAALWMRYVHGFGPAEIAQRCAGSSSPSYGRQLIHRCLRDAREALARLRGHGA